MCVLEFSSRIVFDDLMTGINREISAETRCFMLAVVLTKPPCYSNFPGKIKCQWKTSAGTARSPRDYTETTGAVDFAAGARSTSINITIVDNNIAELGKTFTVELFNPEGGGK